MNACRASGPPPSVIDVERVRSKLEEVKARKAAAAAGGSGTGGQQPVNQQAAAAARAALGQRLASSGGRLKVVDFMGGAQQPSATGQQMQADVEADQDEERFASLRRKAGKLARQERRAAATKGDTAAQPRGFS